MLTLAALLACVDAGTIIVPGAPDVDQPPDDRAPALQAAVDAAAARNRGFGGVSVAVADGAVLRGVAGDAREGGPAMATDTAFEVASVTKLFTAVLILGMVREGRFDLDDRVGDLLDLPNNLLVIAGADRADTITVRQLLQHTSGLPDYWTDPPYVAPGVNRFLAAFLADDDRRWDAADILAFVPGLSPIGRPGERWHYSDTNYVLLGALAERQLGVPYHRALRERVLGPLGLDDTWMVWEEDARPVSARYEERRDLTRFLHQSADWAGGGLASTTDDLLALSAALTDGRAIGAGLFDAMLEPVPTGAAGVGYGLGVFLVDLGADGRLWGHDGYGGAFLYTWPERDLVLAGTVNQTLADSDTLQAEVLAAFE
jgi:CubicO group peptidase (beta-lactamase class C family)